MKFFDMIADFFMTPVDSVMQWLNDMQVSIGVWWSNLWKDIGLGVAHFAVHRKSGAVGEGGQGVWCDGGWAVLGAS